MSSGRPSRTSGAPPSHDRRSLPHRERNHGTPRQTLSGESRQSFLPSEPPPGLYNSEVKRASLLPDDFDELPPHLQSMLSAPPPSGSPFGRDSASSGRLSFNPGYPEPARQAPAQRSMPPAQRSIPAGPFDEAPITTRRSLNPLASLQSLLPGVFRQEQQDDPRFQDAVLLRRQDRKLDAMLALEDLRRTKPDYPQARELVFTLAVELGAEDRVRKHADWMVAQQNLQQDAQGVCASYRSVRMACPTLSLSEKTLVAVLVSADKTRDGRAAVDVTKLLLRDFPLSTMLPRAFMSSAQVQIVEGRPDLARATLESLLARFPHDTLAVQAKKMLEQLT